MHFSLFINILLITSKISEVYFICPDLPVSYIFIFNLFRLPFVDNIVAFYM